VSNLVKRHADKLETVEAFPIERERAQVTFEELETHYKKLEVFLKTVHLKFLFNVDESGLDEFTKNQTISFMMDFVRLLIIVNRKTMDDLLPFGFLSGLLGKIISSETEYATFDVFEVYVKDILILHVCKLKRVEKLPDAKAGILLDGHYSHENPKALVTLKENNIETTSFHHIHHILRNY
jgi:hypothetical protein